MVFGIPASIQQHRYSPILKDASAGVRIDWARVGIVAFILVSAISTNVFINVKYTEHADSFPFIGVAVCLAILLTAPIRKPEWSLLPGAFKGACFLLSLVLAATMMPVERLPAAAWQTAFGLGFLSAVFDNIPLTALALAQGGYDWGMLAYAVGFGGSMIWFGSSAGVAISSMYPEARSVGSLAEERLARHRRLRRRLLPAALHPRLAAARARRCDALERRLALDRGASGYP